MEIDRSDGEGDCSDITGTSHGTIIDWRLGDFFGCIPRCHCSNRFDVVFGNPPSYDFSISLKSAGMRPSGTLGRQDTVQRNWPMRGQHL